MLPDDDVRRRKLFRVFEALVEYHHLSRGGAEVAVDGGVVGGAALWDPPGQWRQSRGAQLRAMPRLLLAFGPSIRRGVFAEELMAQAHPE